MTYAIVFGAAMLAVIVTLTVLAHIAARWLERKILDAIKEQK